MNDNVLEKTICNKLFLPKICHFKELKLLFKGETLKSPFEVTTFEVISSDTEVYISRRL